MAVVVGCTQYRWWGSGGILVKHWWGSGGVPVVQLAHAALQPVVESVP